jgi:hypothetical protein
LNPRAEWQQKAAEKRTLKYKGQRRLDKESRGCSEVRTEKKKVGEDNLQRIGNTKEEQRRRRCRSMHHAGREGKEEVKQEQKGQEHME